MPRRPPASHHGDAPEDPTWDEFWSAQRGWKRELRLLRSAHGSFNDGVVFYPQAGFPASQLAEMIGTLEPRRNVVIQRAYIRAFFDQHLRCRRTHLNYPEMILRRGAGA